MPLPTPHPGLVIRYSYLWVRDSVQGAEEGSKDRPCAIVMMQEAAEGVQVVTVVPITHSPPDDESVAIEMPDVVKDIIGLDAERSWVVVSEVNSFVWPGFDLRPLPGTTDEFDYGTVPAGFFNTIKQGLLEVAKAKRLARVKRDDDVT